MGQRRIYLRIAKSGNLQPIKYASTLPKREIISLPRKTSDSMNGDETMAAVAGEWQVNKENGINSRDSAV